MRYIPLVTLLAVLTPAFSGAQGSGAPSVVPLLSSNNIPVNETASPVYSAETQALLRDRAARDRNADVKAAMQIQSEVEARQFIDGVLAEANAAEILADSSERARIRVEEAGRTESARAESIDYLKRRLRGEASLSDAPESFRSRLSSTDVGTTDRVARTLPPQFYDENRRVVTFRSMTEVPPVLIASSRMNRVTINQVSASPYASSLIAVERRPVEYAAPEAYAVSYTVDPASEIARDDVLFVQGSTDFQDAYSHDLVVDLAIAISDPALSGEQFVIEGHASAEGQYDDNLSLSQARAERIVREIVRYGVPSSQLIPVGFGENEAEFPANATESLRAMDRRVTVYRLK